MPPAPFRSDPPARGNVAPFFRQCVMWSLLLAASAVRGDIAFEHPGALFVAAQFTAEKPTPAQEKILELAATLRETPAAPLAAFDVPAYSANQTLQQERVKGFQEQVRATFVTALAARLAGRPEDTATAKRIILAWAATNRSVSGQDGPVVMNYLGVGLLVAADLIWDSFSAEEHERIRQWTRTVILRQAVAPEQRVHKNNHQSWAIFTGLMAAFILHDRDLFESYARLLDLHVGNTIASDGKMPLEELRGERAGWYSYFALAPILAAVQVVQNVSGEQLWDIRDRRIEKAIAHLYEKHCNPDRLGAGSGVNPENLFEAASGAYGHRPWADADYLRKVRPIDASNDQHVAWEFPTAFKAHRKAGAPKTR